ncbi:hypothetical protein IEO21_01104 [Rhodonia placenta]|uniref:DUF1753-domain-containing protein n=2 Tax=Rhodonia placenta TaxID=104341 RepID=A0A1X6N6R4_9APHY|nr:hypothetical protein POSPLADRAFT_1179771 [Postia placenta MAD-698-R-SB12]KAF9820877.1 hypothetical protein IEO21_01104 [Postia placenta]OSX64156.1 hypothetical protein POSPLADRAFT_1179771 [Postia placenta MAD-698-R-SB12]
MKLTLRPEWRLRPFASALGFLDLKTAVTIVLLFAVLNKVAGVYGLVAVFTGAGGSAAQLSMYIYSVIGLVGLVWGLRVVSQENPKQTLYFAHLFFADHVLSTAWLVFFAVVWWVYTPHDGRRQANSAAQEEMMNSGPGLGSHNMTQEERERAATIIWHEEKGLAIAVIVLSWVAKIYFAALIYSYAIHLRKGSYRSLPRSRPSPTLAAAPLGILPDEEDEAVEDFYRLPVRTPPAHVLGHSRQSNSLSGFADFVSAPGPARRGRPGKSGLSASLGVGGAADSVAVGDDEVDEVLFDEDELARRAGTSAEESTSGDSLDEGQSRSTSHSRRPSRNAAVSRG